MSREHRTDIVPDGHQIDRHGNVTPAPPRSDINSGYRVENRDGHTCVCNGSGRDEVCRCAANRADNAEQRSDGADAYLRALESAERQDSISGLDLLEKYLERGGHVEPRNDAGGGDGADALLRAYEGK